MSEIIAEWLREERKKCHLTQLELAAISEIGLSQIGAIERGEGNPTMSTMIALSTAMKASPDKIMRLMFPHHVDAEQSNNA
ncbi:helix-turn-helix transcriptional regulator [Mucilaginibacter sp. SJ]|uniref:helix-turn-helix transcriptional regulator n=1 Tax=Mucilaginibacter sp. SJ TaxID=3029053 RepID=UPI0023A9FE46|nr:helix-turn-helix transcriptional regulator [Mucilaginibacter sp. SJ]WEA00720.1 helix-turn-helix transcriptional regulator [Mucilaginibacter sp. SJ]